MKKSCNKTSSSSETDRCGERSYRSAGEQSGSPANLLGVVPAGHRGRDQVELTVGQGPAQSPAASSPARHGGYPHRRSASVQGNSRRHRGLETPRIRSSPFVPRESAFRESRSEEHTSELQSLRHLVCRLL